MQQAAKLEAKHTIDNNFLRDVLSGLSQSPKQLHPKYFYDARGSDYFDQICQLPEYYLYRAELDLLPTVAADLAGLLRNEYTLIEFGAGSLQKVEPLLQQVPGIRRFMPIDISGDHLHQACRQLQQRFPALQIKPVVADFSKPVTLETGRFNRLGFFPGSTIGNFNPGEARDFLANAGNILGTGHYLLIGVDTKKSPQVLHDAYNDSQGVTAHFNLNILERINRELGADIDTRQFDHYAFYNPTKGCVEMHLISRADQTAAVGHVKIVFVDGESVHTESSYKYTADEFTRLAQSAGWQLERSWMGRDKLFGVHLLRFTARA